MDEAREAYETLRPKPLIERRAHVRPVRDDLALATVLISEAILRIRVDPPISHVDLKESLAIVLGENAVAMQLVPLRPAAVLPAVTLADAASPSARGAGTIADATQPRIRRGA